MACSKGRGWRSGELPVAIPGAVMEWTRCPEAPPLFRHFLQVGDNLADLIYTVVFIDLRHRTGIERAGDGCKRPKNFTLWIGADLHQLTRKNKIIPVGITDILILHQLLQAVELLRQRILGDLGFAIVGADMLEAADDGVAFQVENIQTVVGCGDAQLAKGGLGVQRHRVTAGEIQLLLTMRTAVGDGDMLFGIIDLDIAAGINQDLFCMPFASGETYNSQEQQEAVEFLHSVCISKERPAPVAIRGWPVIKSVYFEAAE